jgi:hypothetical protein
MTEFDEVWPEFDERSSILVIEATISTTFDLDPGSSAETSSNSITGTTRVVVHGVRIGAGTRRALGRRN